MKIKAIYIFSLLILGFVVVFTSCEEKDDYNYNAIEPGIAAITGDAIASAHGLTQFPVAYYVPARGGSSFAWTATSPAGTPIVVQDPVYPSRVSITWPQSSDSTTASLKVVETTQGGKTAEFTKAILLKPFCVIPDNLMGVYVEADGDGQVADVTFAKDPTDPAGVIITNVLGQNYWWGTPSGGKIKVSFDYCTGAVTLAKQATGIVDGTYGAVSLELSAGKTGSFDPATGVFTIPMTVTVAAGSFGGYDFVYTKKP